MNYKLIIFVLTFYLSYNTNAIFISYPISNTDIVAGSTLIITWSETNITLFDIQLKNYSNHTIVSRLASNVNSTYNARLISLPENLSPKNYSIALTHNNTELASVGPLQLLPEIEKASPTTNVPSSNISIPNLVTSTTAPTETISNNSSNIEADTENIKHIGGKDLGPTLSSDQVAIISVCIGASASVLFCLYIAGKSFVKNRRSSSTFGIADGEYPDPDNQNPSHIDYYSSNNSIRSIPAKKKVSVMGNIYEEDTHYDSMYYGQHFTEGFVENRNSFSPSSSKQNSSSINRISSDYHPFGQPPQHFNNNKYYIDLPLPPPSTHGSQYTHEMRRTSSPTVPPLSPSKIYT